MELSKTQQAIKSYYDKGYRVINGNIVSPKGRVLKTYTNKDNYETVGVRVNGQMITLPVHRLLAYQKFGEAAFAEGIVTRHLDSNPSNNLDDNIIIGTQAENMMDKSEEVRISTAKYASTFNTKYNHDEVKEYYRIHGFKKTMENFNITSKGTMSYIINK